MSVERVCPAYALAHTDPSAWGKLSPAMRLTLRYSSFIWLRPEQRWPAHKWRSLGYICGRGFGKTYACALQINEEIRRGTITELALCGPSEDRIDEIQVAELIRTSPPWFRPERVRGGLEWPNGARAEFFTAESPEKPRGGNFQLAWLCEIVAWAESTRWAFFYNVWIATRNAGVRVVYDTTSKGRNEVIRFLLDENRRDPTSNVIIEGSTFDNPGFSKEYLASLSRLLTGVRAREEFLGEVFEESAGALWTQALLNRTRRPAAPTEFEITLVAIDPALSARKDADMFGIIVGARGRDKHAYIIADYSGHYLPDEWGAIVVDRCARDAAGIIIETNRGGGDGTVHVIVSTARTRGMTTEEIGKDDPFPRRRPGHIFIKRVMAYSDKASRASGPAAEYASERAHIVGELPDLEFEMMTYEQGSRGKSPNRYDAHAYLVTELAGLQHEGPNARARESARDSAAAQAELARRLRVATGRGRFGL